MGEIATLLMKIFLANSLFVLVSGSSSYNILALFHHPGHSHFAFFEPLLRGLADKGHNVTVLGYFPIKDPPGNYHDVVMEANVPLRDEMDLKHFEKQQSTITAFRFIENWGFDFCDKVFASKEFKFVISSKVKYDLIITEQFNNDCMMVATYLLNAPAIALSSCNMMPWHFQRMGTPFLPSFMPITFMGNVESMNFYQRLKQFVYFHLLNYLFTTSTIPRTNIILKKHFGPNTPPIELLVKNTTAFFINQHYSLTGVRPYIPTIVELGGLQVFAAKKKRKPKDFDEEIQKILDSSDSGVIYISWGSLIRSDTLPISKRNAILNAIHRLNNTVVLWKWENETFPETQNHVYIRKWMPQAQILCHPNVKVFMTHGGLLGSSEAAYCGVPVISTPIHADQFLNSQLMQSRGMGVILNYNDMNEDNIYRALSEVLSGKYQKAVKQVSYAFRNRPMNPLDLGIWWAEHVIETGGSPLTKTIGSEFSWFKYFSVDVMCVFGVLLLIVGWFTSHILNVVSTGSSVKIKKQ